MAKRKLYSLNALAVETARNFRTLSRALSDVKPDGRAKDGKPVWHLSTAVSALAEREKLTGRVLHRAPPERHDPQTEAWCAAIEASGKDVDALLAKLRGEPNIERRRALVEGGAGKVVGAHARALAASVGTGTDAFLRKLFVEQQVQAVMSQVVELCEWRIEA